MKGQIRIVVEKDGKVTLGAEGVIGPQCLKLTEFLEGELGDVIKRQKTSEFYRPVRLTHRNHIEYKDTST